MKTRFALLCLLFLAAVTAPAATVRFAFTNYVGEPDTNWFLVYPVGDVAQADGSFITKGPAVRLTPNASGLVTNRFEVGNYIATNRFLGRGIAFRVPNDHGPTVYCATCGTNNTPAGTGLAISGYNTFVTVTYGTNPPPTYDEITNSLGYLPTSPSTATNIAAYQAQIATNSILSAATNIAAYQAQLATNAMLSGAQVTNAAAYQAKIATNGLTPVTLVDGVNSQIAQPSPGVYQVNVTGTGTATNVIDVAAGANVSIVSNALLRTISVPGANPASLTNFESRKVYLSNGADITNLNNSFRVMTADGVVQFQQVLNETGVRFTKATGDGSGITNIPQSGVNGLTASTTYLTNLTSYSNSYNGAFAGLATGATNIQAHVQRLPWTTLNKLENGKPVKVLWLGDSLATQDYQNIWRQSFMTNLLSRYGTNGWFGGGYLIPNAWNPSLTGVGNIQQVNDATAIWYEQLWRVTNGFTQVWSALSTGDGFFDADEVSIAYLKTNSLANGTLTIKTVDDSGFTNTIAVINCNGAYSIVETNISINPARIKLQISASGGSDVAFATPGVFWSGGTGVRYGTLGQGGLNNFLKDASWVSALAGYQPDLLLAIDANNEAGSQTMMNLIVALQTNLPFMDVAYVQMPTSSDDYLNNATGLDAQNARRLIQAFAQTNKNTAYFDNYFYNGSALGYQALTNDSQGIKMVLDGIHPSTTNPTLANFLGRKLYEQLGFQYAASSVAGGTVQTNISYLAVTNAPWLTNSDTRSVYFNGGGLTPLVVNGYINSTGANAGFTFMYRDDVSKFTRMSSKNGAFFKVGTSEAYNYPPDYGIGGLVLSNTGGVLSWDAEVVPSNNWLGFNLGYAYPPNMRATNIEARGVITGNGSGLTNIARTGVTGLEAALSYLTNNTGGGGASGAWNTNGNSGLPAGSFIGTTDATTLVGKVNNKTMLEITNSGSVTLGAGNTNVGIRSFVAGTNNSITFADSGTIGGGWGNIITANQGFRVYYPTIGGGLQNVISNKNNATSFGATVSGGYWNFSGDDGATISGGQNNTNTANYGVIGGGLNNTATGPYATIPGGTRNNAAGGASIVVGGQYNSSSGSNSFAAGFKATSAHTGAFVWADTSEDATYQSSAANTFNVRAAGGAFFSGGLTAAGTITGNGAGVTNIAPTSITPRTGTGGAVLSNTPTLYAPTVTGTLLFNGASSAIDMSAGPVLTDGNGSVGGTGAFLGNQYGSGVPTWSFNGSALTNISATGIASRTGNGAVVLSNTPTVSGITLSGITTNTGGWVGGLNMTNPATGSFVVVTNGGITAQAAAGYNILTNGVVSLGANAAAARIVLDGVNGNMTNSGAISATNGFWTGGLVKSYLISSGNAGSGLVVNRNDNAYGIEHAFNNGGFLRPIYSGGDPSVSLGDSTHLWTKVWAYSATILGGLTSSTTITATNGVFGAYGSATMNTNNSIVAVNNTSNQFAGFTYMRSFGGIGTITNSFWVTNAGDYRISFGAAVLGTQDSDTTKVMIFTNGVHCGLVSLAHTFGSPIGTIPETGFKEFVVPLSANTVVSMFVSSLGNGNVQLNNVCLNVKGAN